MKPKQYTVEKRVSAAWQVCVCVLKKERDAGDL